MAEETIFSDNEENKEEETQQDTQQTTITIPQELREMVGEGKKYRTVEEALASIPHAQKHISTLEEENKTYKTQLSGTKTVKELIDELKSTKEQPATTVKSSIDEDVLNEAVNKALTAQQRKQIESNNQKTVSERFIAEYGDKGEENYNKLAKESGLSIAQLNILASTSPSAIFRMAGLNSKPKNPSSTNVESSVNTMAMEKNKTEEPLNSKVTDFSSKGIKEAFLRAKEAVNKKYGIEQN